MCVREYHILAGPSLCELSYNQIAQGIRQFHHVLRRNELGLDLLVAMYRMMVNAVQSLALSVLFRRQVVPSSYSSRVLSCHLYRIAVLFSRNGKVHLAVRVSISVCLVLSAVVLIGECTSSRISAAKTWSYFYQEDKSSPT